MYSQPTFSANNVDLNEYWWNKVVPNANKPLLNRAIEALYEPGSIAKVVTVSAFLENSGNPDRVFPVRCAGSTVLNGTPFWCWKKHGKVTSLEQTIGSSCNIAMKALGDAAGGPKLSEYSAKFGFNTPLDLGIKDKVRGKTISWPVAQSVSPATPRNAFETAYFSCGLSEAKRGRQYMITPLHAAMLAATIANKGIMMKPYLIKDIKNINGKPIYTAVPKELKKSIDPETALKLTGLMVDTVDNGIGKKARIKGVSIAGKTGTSGKSGELNAWFITFAPAEDPQYAIAIIGEKSGTGMDVAAPIAADIYKALFK
jgi:peptidoglycan glycosyltransferase